MFVSLCVPFTRTGAQGKNLYRLFPLCKFCLQSASDWLIFGIPNRVLVYPYFVLFALSLEQIIKKKKMVKE